MKQILIVLTALILIVSLHFVQGCFLTKTSEILMVKIQRLEESLIDNESVKEDILKEEKEIQVLWKKKQFVFEVFCEHDGVDEIKENISNIHRYISLLDEEDDIKLELLLELNILKQRVKEVVNNEKLKLTNVL